MNQDRIKRVIGKTCIGILVLTILGLFSLLYFLYEFSITETLGAVLGVALLFFIAWAAVYWGDL